MTITAWFLLGWTLGGFVLGWLGDRYGRLRAMLISILIYSVFTGLGGLCQTWEQLAVCRFLTGLGIGGELVSIATYLTEIWPARSRMIAIGALLTSYQAGVFLAGGLHYLVPDWRMAFIAGALPALCVVVFRLTLKESDAWQEAHASHVNGQCTSINTATSIAAHWPALLVGSMAFAGLLIGYWGSLSWIPTWINQLTANGAGPASARSTTMMVQGLCAVVGCLLGGVASQRWTPRWTVCGAGLGCLLASWLLFKPDAVWSNALYAPIGLLGFFVGALQAAMYVYIPALFHTAVRAFGTGLCLNVGRILTIVAVLSAGQWVAWLGGYAQACLAFSGGYLLLMAVIWQPATKPNALTMLEKYDETM
jgi:predicted MFS family arabinose efflux permease